MKKTERNEEIRKQVLAGATIYAAAKVFHISPQRVSQIVRNGKHKDGVAEHYGPLIKEMRALKAKATVDTTPNGPADE